VLGEGEERSVRLCDNDLRGRGIWYARRGET
jgi:hypothetical protein